jgi:hypothetical protein
MDKVDNINKSGKYKEAYKFSKASNVITSLVFLSPLILICMSLYIITSYNSKALIFYLLFLVLGIFIRYIFINRSSKNYTFNPLDDTVCSSIYYKTYYGSLTITVFIFGYTLFYFLLPMLMNKGDYNGNGINYILIVLLIGYLLIDIMVKKYYNCYKINNVSNLLFSYELFTGALVGSFVIIFLNLIKMSDYVYYYPYVNKQTVCKMVNNNTYGCYSN